MDAKHLCRVIGSALLLISLLTFASANYGPTLFTPVLHEGPEGVNIGAADSNFSTYIGGSDDEDATKVTFDNEGNTILIGQTGSGDFPVTTGVVQEAYGGGSWDAFVVKFNPSGDILFATLLGGNAYEHVTWVTVDDSNNIIVAGTTSSTNFPTTESAYKETYQGGGDGFISKLSPDGETLLFSTYFGGTGEDWIYGMEFDGSGNLMFTGWTTSTGLATSGVVQETHGGNLDIFLAKLSSNGQNLHMFSYLGGTGFDRGWTLASDEAHNYVITGVTTSSDFPTTIDALQSEKSGADDAYLAVVSSDGTHLNYSSYLGGSADDYGLGIKVDSSQNIILAGVTESANFNVTNAYQGATGGYDDIFITKITPNRSYAFSTYLGGSSYDRAWELAVDHDDNIIVLGRSTSSDYPVVDAYQDENQGLWDAVVTKMAADGQSLIKSTYWGGSYTDLGEGVAVDSEGHVVISGSTSSDDIPISEGAAQTELGGAPDVFVSHIAFDPAPEEPTTTTTGSSSTTTNTTAGSTGGNPLGLVPLAVIGIAAVVVLLLGVALKSRK